MAEKPKPKSKAEKAGPGVGAGKISIAEEVIASIASIAASEVEGLGDMKRGGMAEIVGIFGGRQKGVETRLENDKVHISLKVTVQYGYPIHEVARRIQEKVTADVEGMTGLQVDSVDVYVQDLRLPEPEPQPQREAEEGAPAEGEGEGEGKAGKPAP